MRLKPITILFVLLSSYSIAQTLDTIDFAKYKPEDSELAISQIMQLKDGALVVRLKDAAKSIAAYEEAGRKNVADRMRKEYAKNNLAMYVAFTTQFKFCPVYFIKTKDTRAFIAGKRDIFLNDKLQVDTTIKMAQSFYLIAEQGAVMANTPSNTSHYRDVNKSEPSTYPIAQNAIFLSDTTLEQLKEPFPFYVVQLFTDYNNPVKQLNARLISFYIRAVALKQKKEIKEELKKMK